MGFGIAVVFSPWVIGPNDRHVVLNALIVGLLIYSVSSLELAVLQRWQEWVNLALGIWLLVSPWVFAYDGLDSLAVTHYVLGALVAALAAFELWQDNKIETAR
jgi:O-antigen/teichoic acid export membrane protein